jgi:hypothetical protein
MAADTTGVFSTMFLENLLARETSRGSTWEKAGRSNTSSKVNPSASIFFSVKDILSLFDYF